MDFISYLKTLQPEDWNKQVTDKWTVKDVVAHMVGWEKGDSDAIQKAWETKEKPWWLDTSDYDEFNRQNVKLYKDYTPEELIKEWEKCEKHNENEIERIGEDKLRSRPDLFRWLFEEGEDSHYNYHYKQIKEVLGKQ